ncbi:cytochrome b5, partial [Terfezia boudieri ATCC MYA-4762]
SLGSVLKAIASALVIVPALSYLIMDGESFTFGYHPAWARWDYWEKPTIRVFTDEQLSLHDGRDPTLPLLLAINGSVFDVSSNPTTYGPGGGYSVFTGADAARGFVTGCFKEDRTWDLRGVEGMFLELDDELDLFESGHWSELKVGGLREGRKKELRQRAEKRRAAAWEKVVGTINHWDKFFRNHEKYKYVGEVRHRDLSGEPVRSICANALKKRPP